MAVEERGLLFGDSTNSTAKQGTGLSLGLDEIEVVKPSVVVKGRVGRKTLKTIQVGGGERKLGGRKRVQTRTQVYVELDLVARPEA